MVDFKRFTVSVSKNGDWRAYDKKTNQSHENVVAKSKDKLVCQLKESTGFTKHYRRRNEWVLTNETVEVQTSKQSE